MAKAKTVAIPIDVQMDVDSMTLNQREHFDCMLAKGEAPRFAAMCALQQSPAGKSDENFARERGANGGQFSDDPAWGDFLVQQVKKKNPNFSPKGKVHVRQLAQSVDDERAWVQDMAELKAVATERNMAVSSQGAEVVKPREIEYDRTYKVNQKIVDREARVLMKEKPKLKLAEAREAARDAVTPKGLKKGVEKKDIFGDD